MPDAAPGTDCCPPRPGSPSRWLHTLIALAILLAALVWRLLGITTPQVWPDEAVTLMLARLSWWDLLVGLPTAEGNPPLGFAVFKLWSLLFPTELGMRLLPVLFGVATVAFLMAAARSIHPKAWIYTGLLAAFSPVPIHYSQELRAYSFLLMAAAMALWATERVHARPTRIRMVTLAASAALAAHVHAVGLFVYPMCAAYLLVRSGRAGFRTLLRPASTGAWLLLISPIIWFNVHWAHAHQQNWWVPPVSWGGLRYYFEDFFGVNLIEPWMRGDWPQRMWAGFAMQRAIIFGCAGLAIAGLADRRMRRPVAGLLAAVVVYFGLMLFISLISVPCILMRTLLPGWGAVLLLMGVGAAGGTRIAARLSAMTCLAAVVLVTAGFWEWDARYGPPRRPASPEVYQWVRENLGPHDLIVSWPSWIEDQSAYEFGEMISGDRLLGINLPLYAGNPARRTVTPMIDDPNWAQRLKAAIARAREASGGNYAIWYIKIGIGDGDPAAILAEGHRVAGQLTASSIKTVSATRYVPSQPNAGPASRPASTRPPQSQAVKQ